MVGHCPSASCVFLASFFGLSFAAAAAGVGGRGPFHFAGAFGPASFNRPLLAVVQFLPPRGWGLLGYPLSASKLYSARR